MKRQQRINQRKAQARKRDYKAEYRRRIAKGESKGLSRSQARGHARAGETPAARSAISIDPNDPRERALRRMKAGETLTSAAKSERISRERLRSYLVENVDARRVGRGWKIIDHRAVEIAICSRAKFRWVKISNDQSSIVGHYWNAVNRFLGSNDPTHLTPFIGKGVRDGSGKYYSFEVRPNTLRRLDSSGELHFLEIYRNVTRAGSARHG
jgi:hypothetical protein